MPNGTANDMYTIIREEYKPANVDILFIGESRPVNGTFFYHGNSNLYRYTREAFMACVPDEFTLAYFKQSKCWLYDVCLDPINHLPRADRIEQVREGLTALADILMKTKPQIVIMVKKGDFYDIVSPVLLSHGFKEGTSFFSLPFPACGRQAQYVQRRWSNRTCILRGRCEY